MKAIRLILLGTLLSGSLASANPVTDHMWQGTKDTFSGSRLWIWGIGSAAALLAGSYDVKVYKDLALSGDEFEFANEVSDLMGTGIIGVTVSLSMIWAGSHWENDKVWNSGVSQFEALVATLAYTQALKVSVARNRPERFDPEQKAHALDSSFPSGHTSTAFATASSLWANHGAMVGTPMMILAALTGYSRIQKGAHYFSDVMFGATIGMATGFGYAQHHAQGDAAPVAVIPYFESGKDWGIAIRHEF